MPTLTIKRMPDQLYRRLKKRAVANRRSLNSEILASLEESVARLAPDVRRLLARADGIRTELERQGFAPVTEASLRRAKRSGRL